jgi:hypothetical protein
MSLDGCGIKAQCIDAGLPVRITLRRSRFELKVDRLEFTDAELQMGDDEYMEMRARLAAQYPYKKAAAPKKKATKADFDPDADAV